MDVLSSGWLGVNLFFFLSGLVLYLPFAEGRRQLSSAGDALRFYRHRGQRLLPLYFFMAILSMVFMAGFQLDDRRFYSGLVGYLTVLFPWQAGSFNPPGNWVMWSIGVEIWFSALFPLLVVVAGRFGFRTLLPAALLLALATRFVGYSVMPFVPGMTLNYVSDSLLGRLDQFCWGMLLAQLIARVALARFNGWLALAGAVLICGTALAWGDWYRRLNVGTSAAFYSLAFDAGIFLVAGWLARSASLVRRALENRPLQLLGMMCYSVYLWHGIVMLRFQPSFRSGWLAYLTYLALLLFLSAVTYRYIEFRQVRDWRTLLPAPPGSKP